MHDGRPCAVLLQVLATEVPRRRDQGQRQPPGRRAPMFLSEQTLELDLLLLVVDVVSVRSAAPSQKSRRRTVLAGLTNALAHLSI
eukprot:3656344-Rhodomonas_salina.2